MTAERGRQLALLWVGLFIVSTAFPILAALVDPNTMPSWLGPLDVAFAAVTALLGFYLLSAAGRSISDSAAARSYRIIQLCSTAFLILVVVFFLAPDAVNWTVLGIGLAWRAWLLVTVLPGVVAHITKR